jgi:hypothetical protein
MTQPSAPISALIVRYANGEATFEEKRRIEEWASESAANRLWLEQFCDAAWLEQQAGIHKKIDLDERSNTFWAMVAEQQKQQVQPTQQHNTGKGKLWQMAKSVGRIAAVLIVVFIGAYLYVLSKKNNGTAAVLNNTPPKPGVVNSTSPQRAQTKPSIDSFSHSGPYKHAAIGGTSNEPPFHKVLIPGGGFMEVILPDGSRAWLNSMTTFVYPHAFKGNQRIVSFNGEACFEVKPNADKPFLAIVNGVHIETNGGIFNVKAHEDEAGKKITVLQGEVNVAAGPNEVFLKENQSALVEHKKCFDLEFNEDTGKVMAWKDKRFLFINDSLAIVAKELARRYNLVLKGNFNRKVTICYEGSKLESEAVVLKEMQLRNRNFQYKIKGRDLIFE